VVNLGKVNRSSDPSITLSRRLVISGRSDDQAYLCHPGKTHLDRILAVYRILKGNLAPGGSVAKITGKEGLKFSGKCRAFDKESDFVEAVEGGSIKKGEKTVVVLRYLGPKGGPGQYRLASPKYHSDS
jgi:dihydroxyacid dehydratase/phosphogluconate dehydratase